MSAPAKPWEGVCPNLRTSPAAFGIPGPLHSSSSMSQLPPINSIRRVSRTLDGRVAPPIPARNSGGAYRQSYSRPAVYGSSYNMGSYGGGYGGATASPFGGYGAYGGGVGGGAYGSQMFGSQMYSSGAYGINRFPQQGMSSLESRFIQMAEENSRPAFESIESLVQAFGSVSFMMESTFHAMYSSFRAVLGVAENFGRLRSLFGQVFQTFAILRLFQWIYRKLLYYLGIRHDNPGREAVWKEATGQLDPKTRRTFWPVAMFLSLVCGGPFLVWRLLKSISNAPPTTDSKTTTQLNSATNPRTWIGGNTVTLPVAVTLYDFTAARENELTVKHGQPLWVAPAHLQTPESDWVLVTINWKESGLVPANFIQVVEHRKYMKPKSKQGVATVKPPENPESSEFSPEIAGQGLTDAEADRLSATHLDQLSVIPDGPHDMQMSEQWAQNEDPPLPSQPAQTKRAPHRRNEPRAQSADSFVIAEPQEAKVTLGKSARLEPAQQPQPPQATGRLDDIVPSQPAPLPPKTNGPFEASS